ncbi:MAG: hypothetical protein WBF04_07010 [Candidatus Sulfotelmatobacter sp.]
MSKCSICLSPELLAIESALASGRFQKDVALQFAVSPYALSRHVRHTATPPAAPSGTEEIEKWLRRADEIWEQATIDQDTRGQAQAVASGLRALETRIQSEKRAAESELPPAGTVPQITVQQIDALLAEHEARETDETRLIRSIVWEFERTLTYNANPVFFELVGRMFRERMFDSHCASAQLAASFTEYARARIAEGSRHDLPSKRGTDELFSQVAN